jgi:hypothetical protein
MDWSKYPLDRLVYFIAALIPGFAALLIFEATHPGSFNWFIWHPFLGYRTKLTIVVLAAFVVGYSISALLGYFLGMLGGAIGGAMSVSGPKGNPASVAIAPWRDPRWRNALKKYLGADAPEDTVVMSEVIYGLRNSMIDRLPEDQRIAASMALNTERINSFTNDTRWSQWYTQFHSIVLAEQSKEWMTQVRHGFEFNLKATALYVLISAIWVPTLRHWWYLVPAILWTMAFVLGEWSSAQQYTNDWTTLDAQIKYLLEMPPLPQQRSLFGGPPVPSA